MGEIAAAISGLEALAALRLARRRAERAIDPWPLQQPGGFGLQRGRRFGILPRDVVHRGSGREIDGGLVVADDGEEVAGAHEVDFAFGGALDRFLIDLVDGGAAVGLAHRARVHHAGKLHVMDENGLAENLIRQIEALVAFADVFKLGNRLACPTAARLDGEVHRAGERPVILSCRLAAAQNAAVADGKLARRAADDNGGFREEQRAHVGAGLPHGDAAGLHRLAAGGVALVGREFRVAGADDDVRHGHVELVGGDLRHGGEHTLADLDAAGVDGDLAGRGKGHPAVEHRIVGERAGQGRVHDVAPARICAAAFATARMMRLCEPQRQILSSRAAAISARVGDGFVSSSALALTMMPARQ